MLTRLLNLFRRRKLDQELDEELRHHVDLLEAEHRANGMSLKDARLAARRDMGGIAKTQEAYREQRGIPVLESILQDIRFGTRSLLNTPGLSATVVVTLALAIGVNSAMFGVIYTVLYKPLPYPAADRLVWITAPTAAQEDTASGALYKTWTERAESFASIARIAPREYTLYDEEQPSRRKSASISVPLGELLDVAPALGRDFEPQDFIRGSSYAALISDRLFRQEYAGDPGILGQPLGLPTRPPIVGVLPPDFRLPIPSQYIDGQSEPDIILSFDTETTRDIERTHLIGRLKDGVAIQTAQAELRTIAASVVGDGEASERGVHAIPLHDRIVGDIRGSLLFLWISVGFILLVACANVANLLLARSSSRSREIAIRVALGAGRLRIMRTLLTESVLLAMAGGAAGVLVSRLFTGALIRWVPFEVPFLEDTELSSWVLAVSVVTCGVTGIVCGILPAFAGARIGAAEAMRVRSGATNPRRKVTAQSLLATLEIALAPMLLTGAGLGLKSIWVMGNNSAVFQPDRVLYARMEINDGAYDIPGRNQFYAEFTQQIEAIPGVVAAGVWNPDHYAGVPHFFGRPAPEATVNNLSEIARSSPHFTQALGIRLLAGRLLDETDGNRESHPVVVNEAVLRALDPPNLAPEGMIGQQIEVGNLLNPMTVVGVVSDFRAKPDAAPQPVVYLPLGPMYYPFLGDFFQLMVRSTDAVEVVALSSAVRRIANQTPGVHLIEPMTLANAMANSVAPRTFQAGLLVAFAGLGVVLAMVGVYGVLSYAVAERTREFGVRLALGATKGHVLGNVFRRSVSIAGAGIVMGLAGALALSRLATNLFYGVEPTDPWIYAAVCAAMLVVALTAAYLPARRATRVDPAETLRAE